MDQEAKRTIELDFDPATRPTLHPFSKLFWPANENADRTFGYMLNRVMDVDLCNLLVKSKGMAVQAGGFVGMWPLRMANSYSRVLTFEAIPHIYRCLELNTASNPHITPYNLALHDHVGTCPIEALPGGCSRKTDASTEVPCISIDSLNLTRLDALFLDVEKGEVAALNGAINTIRKYSPVIMVETHEDCRAEQDKWFLFHGYKARTKSHADRVFTK